MTDALEPRPMHWLKLTLLGWFVHVALAAGMLARVGTAGPRYEQRYREYNLRLPAATEGMLHLARAGEGLLSPWVFGGLALVDLAILGWLARWERPLWGWWFWGVVVVLMLGWPLVELILFLPEWKLREALRR